MKSHHHIINLLLCLILILTGVLHGQSGWTALISGTSHDLKAIYLLNRQTIFVAGSGSRVLKSPDEGISWFDISPAISSVNLNDLVFFDTLQGLVVGDNGIVLRTTDGGTNWTSISSGISDLLLSVSFADSSGICGGSSQSLVNSSDLGLTWSVAQSGFLGGGFWGAFMMTPQIGYVIGENSIFQPLMGKTLDGGLTWDFFPFYLNSNEGRAYDVVFTDLQIGYAACRVWDGRGAIAKTSDGGANWTTTFFGQSLYGISFPISNASLVGYAAGDAGTIIKTGDAGTNWLGQSSGTNQVLNDVAFLDLDYGFAVGDGGTILKTESGGEPPIYLQPYHKEHPSKFALIGNYPNPFNPTTLIRYQLSINNHVCLKVYDLQGKEITTLIDRQITAGKHQVSWNAGDLASGIYYYTMRVGDEVETGKMVLMK